MQVILLQRIEKLGKLGEIVNVRPGYARNGSVSARDIAEALKQEHVTKTNVKIESPIKNIGIHTVRVQLHPEVFITIGVNVAMSEDEAKAQAKAVERRVDVSEGEQEPSA